MRSAPEFLLSASFSAASHAKSPPVFLAGEATTAFIFNVNSLALRRVASRYALRGVYEHRPRKCKANGCPILIWYARSSTVNQKDLRTALWQRRANARFRTLVSFSKGEGFSRCIDNQLGGTEREDEIWKSRPFNLIGFNLPTAGRTNWKCTRGYTRRVLPRLVLHAAKRVSASLTVAIGAPLL